MVEWDKWREYIANGGKGSWPSDAFESLLDYFDDKIREMDCSGCRYKGDSGDKEVNELCFKVMGQFEISKIPQKIS